MCMEGIILKKTVTNFPLWVIHSEYGQSEPSVPETRLEACSRILI